MIPFDVAYRMPQICFDVEVNTDLSAETTTCMVQVHNRSLPVVGFVGGSTHTTRLYECVIRGIGSGGWSLPVWRGGCVVSSRVRVSNR